MPFTILKVDSYTYSLIHSVPKAVSRVAGVMAAIMHDTLNSLLTSERLLIVAGCGMNAVGSSRSLGSSLVALPDGAF